MTMEINLLLAFIRVAQHESFSIAAEALHLTQPAVSKRIATLEQSLDSRLFDRMGKYVKLTEAGSILLPVAKHICNEIEQVQQDIASIGESITGRLSVGTSHHIGLHRLPTVLKEFKINYPQVDLDLHFMDSEDACAKVESNLLELAVVTLPEKSFPNLTTHLVWTDPLVISSNNDHPLRDNPNPTIVDLSKFPAIVPSTNTVTRQVLDRALLPHAIRLNIGMETNYLETIKMLVSVGMGWSALPYSMIDKDLHIVPIKKFSVSRKLGIAHLKKRSLSSAAEAFIQLLNANSNK